MPEKFRRLVVVWLCCLVSGAAGDLSQATAQPSDDEPTANALNWPQWRGPQENGIAPNQTIPLEWSSQKNVIFRVPLPGPSGATPVVWGERIFLTSADGDDLLLMCFDTAGTQRWSKKITTDNQVVREGEGNSASPSPITDGQHVWAMFGDGTLVCLTVEGEEVWRKDLQRDYGKFEIQFGMTSSPVLHQGSLYLQLIHGVWNDDPSQGTLAALDANTGQEQWKTIRQTPAVAENKHSYASPVIFDNDQYHYLISHGADYVMAHDLKSGKEIWRCGGMNPTENYNQFLRFVASPAVGKNLIVVPSAKGGSVLAIRPGGAGDITDSPFVVWKLEKGTPDVPSPIVTDDLVYLCRENGILVCVDAQSGEEYYAERTDSHLHRASPVLIGNTVLLTSRRGVTTVVQTGKQFRQLAVNDLEATISASPAIAGGRIYLRTFDALYAIGEK